MSDRKGDGLKRRNLNIVADENIPFVREMFSELGSVQTISGRLIGPETVRNADILLVRSITRVDRSLLEGSSVKFVGTATIGTDHIDEMFLKETGIGFSNAPGSNANSVAEYVFAALLEFSVVRGWKLEDKSLGVIGVGHIGSRVARRARALGMTVLENDPPLQRKTHEPRFVSLKTALQADIVTFHVPLTLEGRDKTFHLLGAENVDELSPNVLLINASRGPVVDNAVLKMALKNRQMASAVLDVWENEPTIDAELLAQVFLGTPHIAGYSLDGKANGTQMIYDAVCRFLGKEPTRKVSEFLPPAARPQIFWQPTGGSDETQLREIVQQVYAIRKDDARLRKILELPESKWGAYFDQLRKNYPVRREFGNTHVVLPRKPASDALAEKLKILGFQIEWAEK